MTRRLLAAALVLLALYTAEVSADGKSITFLTAPAPAIPRFRLTYTKVSENDLDIRFEVARPESPESFAPYLSGHGRRAAAPPAH